MQEVQTEYADVTHEILPDNRHLGECIEVDQFHYGFGVEPLTQTPVIVISFNALPSPFALRLEQAASMRDVLERLLDGFALNGMEPRRHEDAVPTSRTEEELMP